MSEQTQLLLITAAGLSVFLIGTLALQRWAKLRIGLQPLIAGIRAVVQLAVLAAVLQGVFSHAWTAALMLVLMMTIASATSSRRLAELPYGTQAAVAGIVTSAILTIALVFGMQIMDLTVSNFIAIGGIITGNSMTAATLAGRRFIATSREHRGEIEGWLALGARPQKAFERVSRLSIEEMLLPKIDQTKNTGLVTMPGAFVGALIGGASPVEAARFQLVVLISIMFAQTLCGIIVTRIASRATYIVADEEVTEVEPEKWVTKTAEQKKQQEEAELRALAEREKRGAKSSEKKDKQSGEKKNEKHGINETL